MGLRGSIKYNRDGTVEWMISVKTDETQISKVKRKNPHVEIKKVIEHLIVETEKKSLQ